MRDKYKNRLRLFVFIAAVVSMLYAPCGGGASRSISLGGIVMTPTSSLNISKAVSEEESSGVTCHIYTLEGEDLGSATTAADGSFSIDVDINELRPADATETTWTEPVILECDNGIQLYAEVTVDESSTTSADLGTANINTMLAVNDMIGKISGWSGWTTAYKTQLQLYDASCLFGVMNGLWGNVAATSSGVADDSGILKDVVSAFIASGLGYSAAGYNNWTELIQAVLDGSISSETWSVVATAVAEVVGVDAVTLINSYSDAQTIFAKFDSVFGAAFLADTTADANATLGGQFCSSYDAGAVDADMLVKPMLASDDLDSFNNVYGDEEGILVHFQLMQECQNHGDEACDALSSKPSAYFGFMNSYGGDFSDVYTGGEFDATTIGGLYLAPKSCSGSTAASLKLCAEAMHGTVYTGAGGDWTQFMSNSAFDDDMFSYWGGYYTGLASQGEFDPSGLNYSNLWSNGSGGMSDSSARASALQCIQQIYASGLYDTSECFDISDEDDGGSIIQIPQSIDGSYIDSDLTNANACSFSGVFTSQ